MFAAAPPLPRVRNSCRALNVSPGAGSDGRSDGPKDEESSKLLWRFIASVSNLVLFVLAVGILAACIYGLVNPHYFLDVVSQTHMYIGAAASGVLTAITLGAMIAICKHKRPCAKVRAGAVVGWVGGWVVGVSAGRLLDGWVGGWSV